MSVIILQAGHCHRRTGVVGTRSASGFTEQQFTWPTANRARDFLAADGHDARVILADPPSTSAYRGDVFVAIHADGNNNPSVKGASAGYRTNEGKALAHAWKAAYRALGWPGPFRHDNYTAALGGYYGVRRAIEQGNRRAVIIEAGFLTNPAEADELSGQVGQFRCAQAIRRAVNGVLGHSPAPQEDDLTPREFIKLTFLASLGRLPNDATEQANHEAYLAFHGRDRTIDNIANSPEAKARRPS